MNLLSYPHNLQKKIYVQFTTFIRRLSYLFPFFKNNFYLLKRDINEVKTLPDKIKDIHENISDTHFKIDNFHGKLVVSSRHVKHC